MYYLINSGKGIRQCNLNSYQDGEHVHYLENSLIYFSSKSLPLTIRGNHCSDFLPA